VHVITRVYLHDSSRSFCLLSYYFFLCSFFFFFFFFTATAPTEIYTLSLHDALPISARVQGLRVRARDRHDRRRARRPQPGAAVRSEEHTSELQSPCNLVCRLLLEKKKKILNLNIREINILILDHILRVADDTLFITE